MQRERELYGDYLRLLERRDYAGLRSLLESKSNPLESNPQLKSRLKVGVADGDVVLGYRGCKPRLEQAEREGNVCKEILGLRMRADCRRALRAVGVKPAAREQAGGGRGRWCCAVGVRTEVQVQAGGAEAQGAS